MKHPRNRQERRFLATKKTNKRKETGMRTIEFSLSRSNIIDSLTPLLLTTGILQESDNITDIKIDTKNTDSDLVPVSMSFHKVQAVVKPHTEEQEVN